MQFSFSFLNANGLLHFCACEEDRVESGARKKGKKIGNDGRRSICIQLSE